MSDTPQRLVIRTFPNKTGVNIREAANIKVEDIVRESVEECRYVSWQYRC